jgi:hypothetical protein
MRGTFDDGEEEGDVQLLDASFDLLSSTDGAALPTSPFNGNGGDSRQQPARR